MAKTGNVMKTIVSRPLGALAPVSAAGLLWFHVPFDCNQLVMLLGISLFFLNPLALGLHISTS
jgi:ABC-2 type transport system permease protein